MPAEATVISAILTLSILLFAAKVLAEVFHRFNLPIVLGELTAGMILAPHALGGVSLIGRPLIEVNEIVLAFSEVGAIVLLFIAGLEMSPTEFKNVGPRSFVVGSCGVLLPLLLGYWVFRFLGFEITSSLLVGVAMSATSVAITIQVLDDLGALGSEEARLMVGTAIVDDVLALTLLTLVATIVVEGIPLGITDMVWLVGRVLLLFLGLLAIAILLVPRIFVVPQLWRSRGSIEAVSTAVFFGIAALANVIGLSPLIGAFAAGMALAESKVLSHVEGYVEKLQIVFAPIFFSVIGTRIDLRGLSWDLVGLILITLSIALVSKLVGCGLPSVFFLKDKWKGLVVGTGMVSRGRSGLSWLV